MMNERILELADQTGFIVEGNKIFSDDCFDAINDNLEEFALLIIQECIKISDDSQYSCRTFPVSTSIKQHFGID